MKTLLHIAAAGGVLFGTAAHTRQIEIFPKLSPYDERSLSRPYNPGPKIIVAPADMPYYRHRKLHLPDPTCIAGCVPGRSKQE